MIRITGFAALALLLQLIPAAQAAAQQPRLLRDAPSMAWTGCPPAVGTPPRATLPQRQEAERLAASATQAAILGDTRSAVDLLTRAAQVDPGSPDIAYHLARAYEDAGAPGPAVEAYCRYALLSPDAPDVDEVTDRIARLAASANLTSGPPAHAVRAFEAGITYFDAGRLAEAEDAFSRAWQEGQGWAAPLYNRAVVRLVQDRREAAIADLREYLGTGDRSQQAAEVVDLLAMLPAAARPQPSGTGALLAGLLVPGLGHFTTGQPTRGALVLGAAAAALGAGFMVERVRVHCLSPPVDGRCPPDQVVDQRTERPLLLPAVALAATVGILGAYDAYRGVQRRTAAAGRGANSGEAGISVYPAVELGRSGASIELLRVRFR